MDWLSLPPQGAKDDPSSRKRDFAVEVKGFFDISSGPCYSLAFTEHVPRAGHRGST